METTKQLEKAFGPLWELYNDQNVREFIVDGPNDIYYEYNDGKNREIRNFDPGLKDASAIKDIILALADLAEKEIKSDTMQLHFSIGKNSRVSAVLPPMSVNGPGFNLMKLPNQKVSWNDLVQWNAITNEASEIIQQMIRENKNILIGGNIGSGKTTLANLCVNTINQEERVVTIERVANLVLDRKRLARLEAPNNEKDEMVELVKASSFMRPDWIILNQFEGPEAMNFIELLRDGHSGMGVIGASNIFDCLKRVELKALSSNMGASIDDVRYAIGEAFHYVVFQERMPTGRRVITGIGEVKYDQGELRCEIVYKFKDAE